MMRESVLSNAARRKDGDFGTSAAASEPYRRGAADRCQAARDTRCGTRRSALSIAAPVLMSFVCFGPVSASETAALARHANGMNRIIGTNPAAMRPLSNVGRWLVDSTGRVVQLHGLTLYQKKPPYIDDLTPEDMDFVVREGFNAFRINWIWQAMEPEPGRYNDAYFDKVVALNDRIADHGMRSLIGPAQNAFANKFGGFGAPSWAVLNRKFCGKPEQRQVCASGSDALLNGSDGEFEAWDNFYADAPAGDGVGVLTRFARTWQRMAKRLDGKANVYALDLFHEPPPGYSYVQKGEKRFFDEPVTFERDVLPDFYNRLIAALRQVNDTSMLFYEISNYATVGQTADAKIHLSRNFSADRRLGLSYHFGPLDLHTVSDKVLAQKVGKALATATDYARDADVALMMTGYRLDQNDDQYAVLTDVLGERFIPWNYYSFKSMAGAASSGLLIDPAASPSDANVKSQRLDAMVVPYPQLIAGTPTTWSFDRAARVMRFSYATRPVGRLTPCAGAATEIFVPARHYPQGYVARVTGGRIMSSPTSAWLVVQAGRGVRSVSVSISPTTGGRTERPASAAGPTANVRCGGRA